MPGNRAHPYHVSKDKNFLGRVADFGMPAALFFLFFIFYNQWQFNPREMVKTSGLWAITLLSTTLLVGPLARFFPALDFLKAHRKAWGILSFFGALLHTGLVYVYFFKFNLYKFVDFSNPKYNGILSGLLALAILFLVTMTSSKKALDFFSPKIWKIIQTTSYLALILAVLHFYLMEQIDGVLVIKRLLGRITFWLSIAVISVRTLVMFLPAKKTG